MHSAVNILLIPRCPEDDSSSRVSLEQSLQLPQKDGAEGAGLQDAHFTFSFRVRQLRGLEDVGFEGLQGLQGVAIWHRHRVSAIRSLGTGTFSVDKVRPPEWKP